jgi:alpha-methylacyl-CoA racemase
MTEVSGPLRGVRIVEFAGIGPAPFACMLMSDMGADIVAIHRPGRAPNHPADFTNRGRRAIELDLKSPNDLPTARALVAKADVLIEGFRPGVMEKLGLGPAEMLAANARLVYGRMTGWGQEGPLASTAGHDINYVAITGALDSFRSRAGDIVSPLNLVGDYGGGALFLVVGVLAALLEARTSGAGQVVDAAMCDGVSSLLTVFHALTAMGTWKPSRPGANILDGGAHYYRVYETKDGKHFSVGAIEPQFYAELLERAGINDPEFLDQNNKANWPSLGDKLAAVFKTRTRDEWSGLLEGGDACAMGVQTLTEAPAHRHLAVRGTFVEYGGFLQPSPAPRFSRTPSAIQSSPTQRSTTAQAVLESWT